MTSYAPGGNSRSAAAPVAGPIVFGTDIAASFALRSDVIQDKAERATMDVNFSGIANKGLERPESVLFKRAGGGHDPLLTPEATTLPATTPEGTRT